MSQYEVLATGLKFAEGPVYLPNGDLLVVEIAGGCLTRIHTATKTKSTVAVTGGGPNGAAVGPAGRIYICNNGGHVWKEDAHGILHAGGPAPDYRSGSIQAVDLKTGKVETIYDSCGGNPLTAPNDIVFDRQGGFWFTDLGKGHARHIMRGGIYYALADGSEIREVIFPFSRPNGIALSPDEDKLYVAETDTTRVWSFDIAAPGQIKKVANAPYGGGTCIMSLPGYRMLDSMAVDAEGNVCVAARVQGAIAVASPDGKSVREVPMPDPHTTNICFGGPDMKTAYVTLADLGQLVAMPWHCAGLKPNFFDLAVG